MIKSIGIVYVLIGIITIALASYRSKHLIGYRSFKARMNDDTWKVAQGIAGKIMIVAGIILAVIGFFVAEGPLFDDSFIGYVIILSPIVVISTLTEKKLNIIFDEKGKRRSQYRQAK